MIAHNLDINCTNARLYYYDFLNEETREGIPDGTLQHIKQCRTCQAEIGSLKDLISQADERFGTGQTRKYAAISTLLKLHFNYIAEPVTCDAVKPFLASLADPNLKIRIPTPITAHLDRCRSCRDDLETLLDLHLPHKYLCRLGQLLADRPNENDFSCSWAQDAIPAVVSMDFEETNAEALKHLCTCSYCRERLYQHRESVRKQLMLDGAFNNGFPCESVTFADIYDYCLPYGFDPAEDEYGEFREPLASHIRRCPKCLGKIQELHGKIYDIVERSESEVITTFDIDGSVETVSGSESESATALPAGSEIADSADHIPVPKPGSVDIIARLREKNLTSKAKPLLKAGLAAAAVIAIGFALFFNAPTAGAVTIEQIYRAIENAKNVYIAHFIPGKTEPVQEQWISRSSNIYMTKTGEKSVLIDLKNKVRKEKNFSSGPIKTTQLLPETIIATEEMMAGFLGLVPISDLSSIPKNAEWSRVASDERQFNYEGTEIYDLTWMIKEREGSIGLRRWRVFLSTKDNLPYRTEFYRETIMDTEYTLVSIKEIEYLSDSKMNDIVNGAPF